MNIELIKKTTCVNDARYLLSPEGIIYEKFNGNIEKIYYLDFYEYVISHNESSISFVVEDVKHIDVDDHSESFTSLGILYNCNDLEVISYVSNLFKNNDIETKSNTLQLICEMENEKIVFEINKDK